MERILFLGITVGDGVGAFLFFYFLFFCYFLLVPE